MTFTTYNSNRKKHQQSRIDHWNDVSKQMDQWEGLGIWYHQRLEEIYKFLVPPGQKVLEIGCSRGDFLASLEPAKGIGIDFSSEMLRKAKERHPNLHFVHADAHEFNLDDTFDVIVLSDLLNDLWDVQTVFHHLKKHSTSNTRIIINTYSRLWELPLSVAEKFKLAKPTLNQNWLTVEDVSNLLHLENLEVIKSWAEILLPLNIPFLSSFSNKYLVKLWPFKYFALTNFIVARPFPHPNPLPEKPVVSVIIPARNEAGNIQAIFDRTPEMGQETELVFVEGHSKDNTFQVIKETIAKYPKRKCQLLRQTGVGKGDAVRLGFSRASGDILMILDADLTMPPEYLPEFYEALYSGKGDFINGVRLVYPMENQAMRFFNSLGNKFFSLVFTWLLGQPIKDTLCGTKVLWKDDYERISANRAYFGDFDPFGDFDLLFGASKLGLKIVDLPIRYHARTYGDTNIQRWKHGWLLLKMVVFAARRIKFV